MNRTRRIVALAGAGAIVGSLGLTAAALATPSEVTVYWQIPAGSTGHGPDSYPQTLIVGKAACGVQVQADRYTTADAALFTADGVLTYREDSGHAIYAKRFWTAPCEPSTPVTTTPTETPFPTPTPPVEPGSEPEPSTTSSPSPEPTSTPKPSGTTEPSAPPTSTPTSIPTPQPTTPPATTQPPTAPPVVVTPKPTPSSTPTAPVNETGPDGSTPVVSSPTPEPVTVKHSVPTRQRTVTAPDLPKVSG